MNFVLNSFRGSLRLIRSNPGLATGIILTLGLGIGASTAIFSVVNGVILRDLPYDQPDRLVRIYTSHRGQTRNPNSEANFLDYRERIRCFESVAAYRFRVLQLSGGMEPQRILASAVSAELLPMLGVSPMIGRTFSPEEDTVGAADVVLLSYGQWRKNFGASMDLIGQSVVLQNRPYTVIGIMPAGFQFPSPMVDAWFPLQIDPNNFYSRINYNLRVVARLRTGSRLEDARTELDAYARKIVEEYPENYKTTQFSVEAFNLREDIVGSTRMPLLILMGAVALVLLISCANAAHLLLARSERLNRHIAIRLALGASRGRILSESMAESLVLSMAGGLLGLMLANAATKTLLLLAGNTIPRTDEVGMDWRVLGFAAVVSLLTGMLAGSLPALRTARCDIQPVLQQGGRSVTSSRSAARLRRFLIVAESALAVIVVIGAGIMIRSFAKMQQVDVGFPTDNVLTMQVSLPVQGFEEPESVVKFYRTVLEQVETLPGVLFAGAVLSLPLAPASMPLTIALGRTSIQIEGRIADTIGEAPTALIQQATPGYFQALGLTLASGRIFTERDDASRPPVALVNEAFVNRLLSGRLVSGQRMRMFDPEKPWIEIIGVVKDIPHESLQAPILPKVYLPHAQSFVAGYSVSDTMTLAIRAEPDAAALAAPVRGLIRTTAPAASVSYIQTLSQIRSDVAVSREFPTALLSVFGFMALFLAATGMYGVVSFAVNQRVHEIGVRMALGASPAAVQRMIVWQGFFPVALGIVLGLIVATHLAELLESLLFNISPTDPFTYLSVSTLLAAVALLASYAPARRASRLEVNAVLRSE
jgi:putative ABC transport system permease protein